MPEARGILGVSPRDRRGLQAAALAASDLGVGHQAWRLDDEAKTLRDLRRVSGVLAGRKRPVKRSIKADRAEYRVLGIRRQALLGQR